MIDPLRSSFNSLAIGLLNEGDEKKAIDVLEHAIKTLYPSHLRPSVSNLQAAEILLSVGKQPWAEKLAVEVFEFSFVQVKASLEKDQPVDNLSAYLLQRSELIQYH